MVLQCETVDKGSCCCYSCHNVKEKTTLSSRVWKKCIERVVRFSEGQKSLGVETKDMDE